MGFLGLPALASETPRTLSEVFVLGCTQDVKIYEKHLDDQTRYLLFRNFQFLTAVKNQGFLRLVGGS